MSDHTSINCDAAEKPGKDDSPSHFLDQFRTPEERVSTLRDEYALEEEPYFDRDEYRIDEETVPEGEE